MNSVFKHFMTRLFDAINELVYRPEIWTAKRCDMRGNPEIQQRDVQYALKLIIPHGEFETVYTAKYTGGCDLLQMKFRCLFLFFLFLFVCLILKFMEIQKNKSDFEKFRSNLITTAKNALNAKIGAEAFEQMCSAVEEFMKEMISAALEWLSEAICEERKWRALYGEHHWPLSNRTIMLMMDRTNVGQFLKTVLKGCQVCGCGVPANIEKELLPKAKKR